MDLVDDADVDAALVHERAAMDARGRLELHADLVTALRTHVLQDENDGEERGDPE